VIATMALRVIRQDGGFAVRTPEAGFARASGLDAHLWTKIEHILVLYGADFFHRSMIWSVMPIIHLVGVGLVVGGVVVAAKRFFSAETSLFAQILTASFVLVLAAFVFGDRAGSWEAVGLLPLGAILAGRLLAGWLTRVKLVPALAGVLACY